MDTVKQEQKVEDPDEDERQDRIARMPILEQCYNLMDFEAVARRVMKKTAWAYYSSGADDEIVSVRPDMYNVGFKLLTCNPTDSPREPLCFPQDLVPTPNPRRCRAHRYLNDNAWNESLHPFLRYSHRSG